VADRLLLAGAVGTARAESINTPALFGVGLIDGIPDQDIKDNLRREGVQTAEVRGRVRVLPDGRVGKFGWRAQFATLEEFVAAACSNEIGLGTPLSAQARPLHRPNYPARQADLDRKQFAALLSFVDTLPRPVRDMPADKEERTRAERGEALFHQVGCATCHTPNLGGVQGIYSDLQLHRVVYYGNSGEEPAPAPDAYPLPDEWKTQPLWGVADSAPYFHDGACDSLKGAILRHQGEAKLVKEAYARLSPGEQEEVVAFLRTLKAPSDAAPTNGPGRELQRGDLPLKPPPNGTLIDTDW
jgi:CxxC motif-containing protein (DUF1111 family)